MGWWSDWPARAIAGRHCFRRRVSRICWSGWACRCRRRRSASNNTAAVMVTATLPPFAQPGMHHRYHGGRDRRCQQPAGRNPGAHVAARRGWPGLCGGAGPGDDRRLLEPARAAARQTVNHPTVGRAPSGATVERGAPSVAPKGSIRLQVRQSDFTTSTRIVEAVNQQVQDGKAARPTPRTPVW